MSAGLKYIIEGQDRSVQKQGGSDPAEGNLGQRLECGLGAKSMGTGQEGEAEAIGRGGGLESLGSVHGQRSTLGCSPVQKWVCL